MKSDVILLVDVFQKSTEEFGNNSLYCVSLPGYTYPSTLKYTDINLQTLQDKDFILTLENNIRGGISSVMGDRYVKSDENKKIIYIDATNLYGHSLSQPLPDSPKNPKETWISSFLGFQTHILPKLRFIFSIRVGIENFQVVESFSIGELSICVPCIGVPTVRNFQEVLLFISLNLQTCFPLSQQVRILSSCPQSTT